MCNICLPLYSQVTLLAGHDHQHNSSNGENKTDDSDDNHGGVPCWLHNDILERLKEMRNDQVNDSDQVNVRQCAEVTHCNSFWGAVTKLPDNFTKNGFFISSRYESSKVHNFSSVPVNSMKYDISSMREKISSKIPVPVPLHTVPYFSSQTTDIK